MHTDLLDTVLVSKDSTLGAPVASAPAMKASSPTANPSDNAEVCPVDHKTREAWLKQARAAPAAATPPHPSSAALATPSPPQPSSWSSWLPFARQPSAAPLPSAPKTSLPSTLDSHRVISSIPRSTDPGPAACPSNHEVETGTSASGNWIYPSEKMFFDAMKRKGYNSAAAADMKTVVPIHNAVNERAWAEILRWEAPYVEGTKCGGPRLHSFAGLSEAMSPKARVNTLLGYTAPFDRHDWVVDRCGTRVEYIIDFYAGRGDGQGQKLNFYLDVRPKLNTWEGVKMRALRVTGLA
ncbi:cytochrome c/c1 heme-lyase [Lasiosphaeria hispida]|uniref:Holocytochrome c-type synthase n=1 Tax=Lasiosphaeria hispida TaxID=260671 RepID=A0AAJ0HDL3_9PEZI|nr:cytochrome c/c1 heme-lyase [Lasiosphaeria hispida]